MFRWFLDMSMVEDAFDHSTFSLNRERLLKHDVANRFFAAVVEQARTAGLMSDDHFTVDGTLIDSWASMKSFQRKDQGKKKPPDDPGNPSVNFKGEKRRNETHQSSTDPESELARKGPGQPSRLAYSGHALMENRHGLLVDLKIARGNESERIAALSLRQTRFRGIERTQLAAHLNGAAYNLLRIAKLTASQLDLKGRHRPPRSTAARPDTRSSQAITARLFSTTC